MDVAFGLSGEIFRDVPGRRTMRINLGGRWYFVKLHYGVGWPEVFKNWLQFKRPVIGAQNEFTACQGLQAVGITAPIPAAYASSSGSLAKRRSFVLCDELAGYESLEDYTADWHATTVDPRAKRRLLNQVANFARTFHQHGFIHRDFYICHLLIEHQAGRALMSEQCPPSMPLAVLDLHRARQFDRIPTRWLKRDLAALLFSALDLGYSRKDWLRFIRIYSGRALREELSQRGDFWQQVTQRANKLYREGLRKGIVTGNYTP